MKVEHGFRAAMDALAIVILSGSVTLSAAQDFEINPPTVSTAPASSTTASQPSLSPSAPPGNLPDSPGTLRYQIASTQQSASAQGLPSNPPVDSEHAAPINAPVERQPVGTAAAENIRTSGVAASAPAGIAMAPAKQRQVRSLLIRVGAVLGASAAVGIAFALSAASPAKPPGAH